MGCPAKYAGSSEALAQFKAAVEQGLGRACPNPLCGRHGSKDGQCTHMTCDLCQTRWCYVCGLDVQSAACSLGRPREPDDPLGNPHYRHNVGFQVNQARCPMYLEQVHLDCDATWPVEGGAALDKLHRERALRALRSFYDTVGQEQYRLLVEAFPADCSAAGCGFSEEEILAVQVDAPLYRLGHGQEARAVSLPSQLRQAAREGDEATITLLLAQGVDVNGRGAVSRRTALFYAAWYNHPSTVTQLAAAPSAEVNAVDREGMTPLIIAIVHGHVEVVRTLLALPSTHVNDRSAGGGTPLILATHNIEFILEQDDGSTFEVPLARRVEIINALGGVERLDPNLKTTNDAQNMSLGVSALILAATFGEPPEVVRALLSVPGLDVNAVTDRGQGHTALLTAIRHGHFTLVRLLWETDRVDCSVTDVRGRGALALATAHGRREIASWVLMQQTISAAGHADLAQLDANGTTALHLAASGGQLDVLRLLLETCHQRGLDVGSLRDRQGRTLLTVAAAGGQAAVVSELVTLHRAIDPVVNVPDAKGRTPLVGAARRGVWPVVLALVGTGRWHGGAAGLDANAADPSSGRTALMFAASRGQVDVVRGLLQVSGIDVSVADTHGKTAEDLAIEGRELSPNRFAEIVRELRAADGDSGADRQAAERIVRRRVA